MPRIDFSELIDTESIVGGLRDAADAARNASAGVRDFEESIEETSSTTPRVSASTRDYSSVLSQLSSVLSDINDRMSLSNQVAKQMKEAIEKLSATTRQGRSSIESMKVGVDDLAEAYRSMGIKADSVKGVLDHLKERQKDANKVMALSTAYAADRVHTNEELEQTYNSLATKYAAIKILINEMTVEEREHNKEGQALVSMSEQIMSKMNELQIKTGKYTLQVGNYSRATNGLSLAMAQVVRETPTIMNSWSQFAMAISNNVPILVENIQRYNTEHLEAINILNQHKEAGLTTEEAMKVMGNRAKNLIPTWKALGASLLSLNSIVVVLVLAFQMITKAIEKKKKAQEEANKATAEAIDKEKMLGDATLAVRKHIEEESSKLRTLYAISQDVNRSMEDRIKAANVLKATYKDQLANYSAEQIALGQAKGAYDTLAESIMKAAEAAAYFDEVKKLEAQQIANKSTLERAEQELEVAKASQTAANAALDAYNAKIAEGKAVSTSGQEYQFYSDRIKLADKEVEKATKNVDAAKDALAATGDAIIDLVNEIPASGIELPNTKDDSEAVGKLKDYYWESQKALIEVSMEGKEREIALAKVAYQQEIAELQEHLVKAEGLQKEYIQNVIDARGVKLGEEISAIEVKYHAKEIAEQKKFDNEMSKEIDAAYAANQEAVFTEREQEYNLAVADAKLTIKNKKELFETLKQLEIDYWNDVYDLAVEQGDSERMAEADAKRIEASSKVFTQKRSRSNAPRNLVETIFAASDKYGADNPDGGGRMVQGQYQDLVNAINSNLQTSINYMNEWMDTRIEMAQVAVEAAQEEANAAKSTLDAEIQARANGYASSVEYARKEWEAKKKLEEEAVAEQKRLQKIQLAIDTATQVSSLITATAGLWMGAAPLGLAAPAWAIASTALMWSTFLASKAAALSLINSENYGEGMSEYLDYGGSHASGNDIDFGTKKDGTRRRVERGEMVAVINKRNVKKYGAKNISNIIDSLNHGSFDSMYGNAFAGIPASPSVNLSTLEGDVRAIKEQGERKITYVNGKKIEVYKNSTKVFS